MYPSPIAQYYQPRDLVEALALRATHSSDCKILAGGQSLLPLLKARTLAPSTLIDLNRVQGLDQIEYGSEVIRIGALVRQRTIERESALRDVARGLCEAAAAVGDLQVRNRGTLVGSLCHCDPTSDIAPAAIALGAHLRIARGVDDVRLVPVAGITAHTILPNELATHLEFLRPGPTSVGAYLKYGRVAQDRAIIGIAVQLEINEAGVCERAVIVVGGVVPGPRIAVNAALALIGERIEDAPARAAGQCAAAEVATQGDSMASADYRHDLIGIAVARALRQAGETWIASRG